MDWSKLNPYRKEKGQRDRFYDKTDVAKHREWRGLSDTWYDYCQWMQNLGILVMFVTKSPVRIVRGMLEYRWFGSYLASLTMVDRAVEGLRGPELRTTHAFLHTIMTGATEQIANMMKGDRRFGKTKFADKQVLLEQAMSVEIAAGFKNVTPSSLEAFQGLLGCYMDQSLPQFYLDTMEHYGLPADSCRLSATAAGVSINDDFPQDGACLIVNNMPCDSSTMNSQLIERRMTIPTMVAGMPMRWEDEDTDEYAVKQLKKVIAFIEENTGETFDEQEFFRVMKEHNREVDNEMAMWDYVRLPHSAIGGQMFSLFHVFYYAFSGGRLPYITKTQEKVLKMAADYYQKKQEAFPKTRHRAISWGGPGCYYLQFANWMYNCWGIHLLASMDTFEGNIKIDTTDLDSALTGVAHSYEHSVMRRHLTGGYQHMLEFWDEARRFNADMVIMYDDITCKGAMGMAGIVNDQCKDHPDIHLIWVQNDMFDSRTISRNELRRQVNNYMTAVLKEEPLDATLLDFDDSEGW